MRRAKDAGTLLAPVGVAAVALACCAGLPALAATFAGLTLVTVLGLGGGLLALLALASGAAVILRKRGARRSCERSEERPS